MPLNNTTANALGQSIGTALLNMSAADKADPVKIWQEFARILYAAIKTDAVVGGPVTVTSVAGVTPGGGISGPGTGTMTGGTLS